MVLKPCLQVWNAGHSEAHVHGAEDEESAPVRAEAMLRVVAEGTVGGLCVSPQFLQLYNQYRGNWIIAHTICT